MDLDDTLTSVFNGLAHTTSKIDKYLHNNKPELKDSFVDNFIHELKDFLYDARDIHRLKQMPEDTLFEITGDTKDYFVAIVDEQTLNLPRLNGIGNEIFYIPKIFVI